MEQKQKPIAVVRPMPRDPVIVEIEEQIRALAKLILQRKDDQRRMEEQLLRWETRSLGRAMEPELKALNEHIEGKLEEFKLRIQQLNPNEYPDFWGCYRELYKLQSQDERPTESLWHGGYGYSNV